MQKLIWSSAVQQISGEHFISPLQLMTASVSALPLMFVLSWLLLVPGQMLRESITRLTVSPPPLILSPRSSSRLLLSSCVTFPSWPRPNSALASCPPLHHRRHLRHSLLDGAAWAHFGSIGQVDFPACDWCHTSRALLGNCGRSFRVKHQLHSLRREVEKNLEDEQRKKAFFEYETFSWDFSPSNV